MRKVTLSREERAIEHTLLQGEYKHVSSSTFEDIAHAIARRKKDAVISIRVNAQDLRHIKQKAKRLGIKYQTLLSEFIHRIAV